jgi:hypothetical protein
MFQSLLSIMPGGQSLSLPLRPSFFFRNRNSFVYHHNTIIVPKVIRCPGESTVADIVPQGKLGKPGRLATPLKQRV